MSKLEDFGKNVARGVNSSNGKQEVFIDPASIMGYIALVQEIVKIVKGCMTPEEVVQTAYNPGWNDTRRLHAAVRRKVGFVRHWFDGDKIVNSILKEAKNQTVEDVQEMYYEVK